MIHRNPVAIGRGRRGAAPGVSVAALVDAAVQVPGVWLATGAELAAVLDEAGLIGR